MKNNKKGWIRILEATIAIMLVSGVLLVTYSQSVDKEDISERVYSLQREVLLDIALESGLRQNVLDVVSGDEDDENLEDLNDFARTKIPAAFVSRIRVCDLGDHCKPLYDDVKATIDKDVFVEDIVIAGQYDNYAPKKVRLFIWEAG